MSNEKLIDESMMTRLELIKYSLDRALEISSENVPGAYISVLLFHDAIEWLLQTGAMYLNINLGSKQPGLMEWWEIYRQQASPSIELIMSDQIKELNEVRREFKHRGIEPSSVVINRIRENAIHFAQEFVPVVFSISYNHIDLAHLVLYSKTREKLTLALKYWQEGNKTESRNQLAIAFAVLINEYENKLISIMGHSPHNIGHDFFGSSANNIFHRPLTYYQHTKASDSVFNDVRIDRLKNFVDNTNKSIGQMRDVLRIVSLGINYRKYKIFRWLTPSVYMDQNGEYIIQYSAQVNEMTQQNHDFCRMYIIECALHLQRELLLEFNISNEI
jgi:hypothetical protein